MSVTEETRAVEELASLSRVRELAASGEARRLRLAAGLTQAEVATRCGVVPGAVSRWEHGDRIPRGRAAEIFAAIVLSLEAAYGGARDAA